MINDKNYDFLLQGMGIKGLIGAMPFIVPRPPIEFMPFIPQVEHPPLELVLGEE